MRVSRGLNASNVVEIVTRLVFLFLHSGEGKKCFHCCAKIILRNCWRLLGDTEQILASDSFHRSSLSTGQAGDGRAQVAAAELPATAAAMIITSWLGMSRPWTAPTQMPPKHFSKASRTIALWRSSRSTTREKKRRAPERYRITRQDGTERVIS